MLLVLLLFLFLFFVLVLVLRPVCLCCVVPHPAKLPIQLEASTEHDSRRYIDHTCFFGGVCLIRLANVTHQAPTDVLAFLRDDLAESRAGGAQLVAGGG